MNRREIQERRDTPRVGARLPIQLAESETSQLVTTESVNLSRSGICCRTTEFIAPLAKLDLTLILPPFGNLTKASRILRAEGIVVRCEPVPGDESEEEASEFDVACSFTTLEPEARNLLDAYVAWKILRSARADEERASASPMAGRRVSGVRRGGPRGSRAAAGGRKAAHSPSARKRSSPRATGDSTRRGRRSTSARTGRAGGRGGRAPGRKGWGGKAGRSGAATRQTRGDRKPVGSGGRR